MMPRDLGERIPVNKDFDAQRLRLLQELDAAHAAYYDSKTFGGPSLYFHLAALNAAELGDCEQFADRAYAMLASWGMHRMGHGGSKMCEFADFSKSLLGLWPVIMQLQRVDPRKLDDECWSELRRIFDGICCMRTAARLVGNSKVMAHALPNLIPPIDREYTLSFLFGTNRITNDKEWEWKRLRNMLEDFFHPLLQCEVFQSKARTWSQHSDKYRWDTSPLKILDNLVIGLKKHDGAEAGTPSAKPSWSNPERF